MKSLILEYMETPSQKNIDYSIIEYCKQQNLSVLVGTNKPAIQAAYLDTETFTKSDGEPSSDSDNNLTTNLKALLDTRTTTHTEAEASDPEDTRYLSLCRLMDTQTLTEAVEATDSDK